MDIHQSAYFLGSKPTRNRLAGVYRVITASADAMTTIDKAIQMDPDDANLYDSKGEFYVLAGDGENARVMYEKVLERDSAFYVGYPSTELFDFINNEKK